jgi:hypothetical protein
VLHDRTDEVVRLLADVHGRLDEALVDTPVLVEGALSLITYEGFRWVSQIDPLWNAYFLGLLLRVGDEIEAARIEPARETVFAYQLSIDEERAALFDDSAWQRFTQRSAALAEVHDYVVVADIADHYGRIYHHRLDNSLQLLPGLGDEPSRVEKLLTHFSGGPSYGLPVGGPAARMLAELSLNRIDRLLVSAGITFCRYADDYRFFASTRNDAFKALVLLSELLLRHEGLTVQRQKTRVLASKDFLRSPLFSPPETDELSDEERQERRFLRLSLRYDPYSPTAAEDYERLKRNLEQFDIIGLLTREVNKSRINIPVVRRLAQAVQHMPSDVRDMAAQTFVGNLEVLAPALPVVLRVLDDLMPELSPPVQAHVAEELRRAIRAAEYFIVVPVNLAYALRALASQRSEENVTLATGLFDSAPPFIQRDIVYLMDRWSADYWVSDKRRQWSNQHPWVKRALVLTSYSLGDEGAHWRRSITRHLSPFDAICRDWMAARVQAGLRSMPL